ncbi:MAG: TetR family transcriptional regulator [Nitriliruptorales bacterium]|nr:TetR family transcriptional regulator [Nitriliruptorales bacterium]
MRSELRSCVTPWAALLPFRRRPVAPPFGRAGSPAGYDARVPDNPRVEDASPEMGGPDGAVRASQTAQRLRQAARQAFAELGWQATRVQDVVQRAGVSHGTFYTYYPNKAAVLDDLVRSSQADLSAHVTEPWEADDVRSALEGIVGGLIDLYQRDATILRTWLEAAREERQFSNLYVELRGRYVDRVSDNLGAVVEMSGRDPVVPPRTIAAALVAMVEHLCYAWLVLGEPHERSDVLNSIVLVWGSTLNTLAGFELVRPL